MEDEGAVEMGVCPDCDGQGASDCDQCGSRGMGDECVTCNGLGEIEINKGESE